jgi:hypothetical protein
VAAAGNQRVLAEIGRWAAAYRRGEVPSRLVHPALRPGERLAVTIFPVRISREPEGRPFEQWDPRPGTRSLRLPFRNDGRLVATSERLLLVGHPARGVYDIHGEWPWGDVPSVEVVPNWRGVVLRERADGGLATVIGNVFHTFLVRPSVAAMAVAWLKVTGAHADAGGDLDGWLRELPARLGVVRPR